MEYACKTCTRPSCPGFGNPGACAGTLETEAHPHRLTEKQLDEIVEYQLECFHQSKVGLPFNGRYLLSMIIELREHRSLAREKSKKPYSSMRESPKVHRVKCSTKKRKT